MTATSAHNKIKQNPFEIEWATGYLGAIIPYDIEVSFSPSLSSHPLVKLPVNRTPITAEVQAYHDAKNRFLNTIDCGLKHAYKIGREPIDVRININTPYMPIVSDGKAPDLT